MKLETFYNNIIFKNSKTNNHFQALNNNETSTIVTSDENNTSKSANILSSDNNLSLSLDSIKTENYRSAQLSDFNKNLNIGNLIPLNCGHNGSYSQSEIEMYTLYLLNSKFVL